jgi:hypothetical protein
MHTVLTILHLSYTRREIMNSIYAKLNKKTSLSGEPYRKILNMDDPVYEDVLGNDEFEFEEFMPTRKPEDKLWFYIKSFSNTTYADKLIKDSKRSIMERIDK